MIDYVYRPFFVFFRTRRMQKFASTFHCDENTSVLDVGGSQFNWTLIAKTPKITIVNITLPKKQAGLKDYVVADACNLPFKEHSFDIAYSNSVIEHLGTWTNQQAMAREIQRVGKQFYVQTPNKMFPIEPHYIALFVHWLPKSIQPYIIYYCTLRGWLGKLTLEDCRELVEEIKLLDVQELQNLFPRSEIWSERFLGLVKSLMAVQLR